jgi:polysaccharide export outer membrane protein
MKFIRILLLLGIPLYFFSCKPQQILPNYLENLTDSSGKGEVKIPELKIQKNDLLSIQVYSLSTRPELSDAIYNQPSANTGMAGSSSGYLVDLNGNIEHHRLGIMHAEGLTKQQLATEIKKRLTEPVELLKDPTVIIRFLNYKVIVIGEVAKPGSILVPGERITILEAIGLSGDITQYGRKNTVKVVREIDGKRETGTIDLSSKDLFESPYYNLLQNDVVLVEPAKSRAKSAEQAVVAQKISFALTLATVAAAIANIFINSGK